MARRTKIVTIEDEWVPHPDSERAKAGEKLLRSAGRDKGKVFLLTEMPAVQADDWVTQAQFLIAQATRECDALGLAEDDPLRLVAQGRAFKDPSLKAWWSCVAYQHNPKHAPQPIVQGPACQIDEIATINTLLREVYELHTGFFSPDDPSTSGSPSTTPTGSSPTQMSRPASAPSSHHGSRRFTS